MTSKETLVVVDDVGNDDDDDLEEDNVVLQQWPAPTAQIASLSDDEKLKMQVDYKKRFLMATAHCEAGTTKVNMFKIEEYWLRVMRASKTESMKREVAILSQEFKRDLEIRKSLLVEREEDLTDADEDHEKLVRMKLGNTDQLLQIQKSRISALEDEFRRAAEEIHQDHYRDKDNIVSAHNQFKVELENVIKLIDTEEWQREETEVSEHNTHYEWIRNKNIEEDHQMKSHLEKVIDHIKAKCNGALQHYRESTDSHAVAYKNLLREDAQLSKNVELRLRQVEKMLASISQWKVTISQNKKESASRFQRMERERSHLSASFQELKRKMTKMRAEEHQRLTRLASSTRAAHGKLKEQLSFSERLLNLAELCRKYESERERVLAFSENRKVDVDSLEWDDETVKEEIREVMADETIDEWSYLDRFCKRYNKVTLDRLAVRKERKRLQEENQELISVLKQYNDSVSVNEQVLAGDNPLLIVNGRTNINHVPPPKATQGKGIVDATVRFREMQTQMASTTASTTSTSFRGGC